MKATQRKYVIARAQFDATSLRPEISAAPRTREDFEKTLAPNMRTNVDEAYALYVSEFARVKGEKA